MEDAHLVTAIRYGVEPGAGRLVARAQASRWSSARAHVEGRPDGLTDLEGTRGLHRNWRAMLRHGGWRRGT